MRILSLDQATRVSGYSYFENGEYVASGVVDLSDSKLAIDERSFEMAKSLWKIIKKYQPEHVVLENVQQQKNPSTMISLARLQGMIVGYASAHKIKVHFLSPSSWRSALEYTLGPKIKRAELKQQSLKYVKEHLGLNVSEDEAEAIAEGIAAHKIYNFE